MVQPIPDGFYSVTPYLIVNGAAQAIEFYTRAFNARELMRMDGPGGKVVHAEIQIGNACVMLSDESPEMGARSPQTIGGSPISLLLYVEDVDSIFAQALAAGATELRPVQNQFYGDRSGTLTDPFGHQWTVSTHVEDVSPEELQARMQAMFSSDESS